MIGLRILLSSSRLHESILKLYVVTVNIRRYYIERSHSQCEVSSSSTGRGFQGVPSAGLRIRPSLPFVGIPCVIWPCHLVASASEPAKGQRPKQHLQQNNSD